MAQASADPLPRQRRRRLGLQDQERHRQLSRQPGHALTIGPAQEGGIDHHGETGADQPGRQGRQPLGEQLLGDLQAVGIPLALRPGRLAPQPEQPLALHVRAQADPAQPLGQRQAVARFARA